MHGTAQDSAEKKLSHNIIFNLKEINKQSSLLDYTIWYSFHCINVISNICFSFHSIPYSLSNYVYCDNIT